MLTGQTLQCLALGGGNEEFYLQQRLANAW